MYEMKIHLLPAVATVNYAKWGGCSFSFLRSICIAAPADLGKKLFLGIAFSYSLWYNTIRWLNGIGSVDNKWGYSTVGSALHSHCRGHRFESGMLHHNLSENYGFQTFSFYSGRPSCGFAKITGPFMPMNSPGSIGANSSCRFFGWADWCAHLIERTWAFFMILQISPTSHPATRKVLRSTGFPGRSMPQRLLV